MEGLIERLRLIQDAHRWDDVEMARRCGISVRMWQQAKGGAVRLGHRTLQPILRNFPEVGPEVLAYLSQHDPVGQTAA